MLLLTFSIGTIASRYLVAFQVAVLARGIMSCVFLRWTWKVRYHGKGKKRNKEKKEEMNGKLFKEKYAVLGGK